jgi:hypothetical protein
MFQPKAEPEVDINELMARLNAGRDRAARRNWSGMRKRRNLANLPN